MLVKRPQLLSASFRISSYFPFTVDVFGVMAVSQNACRVTVAVRRNSNVKNSAILVAKIISAFEKRVADSFCRKPQSCNAQRMNSGHSSSLCRLKVRHL